MVHHQVVHRTCVETIH